MSRYRHHLPPVNPADKNSFDFDSERLHDAVFSWNDKNAPGFALVAVVLTNPSFKEVEKAAENAKKEGIYPHQWAPWAIKKGHIPAIKKAIKDGVNLDTLLYKDKPALAWVVIENKYEALKNLLKEGIKPTLALSQSVDNLSAFQEYDSRRLLDWAIAYQAMDCAKVLIQQGAVDENQDLKDAALFTLACTQPKMGHHEPREDPEKWELWKTLIKKGANPFRVWTVVESCENPPPDYFMACADNEIQNRTKAEHIEALKKRTAIQEVLFRLTYRARVHNKDWRHAWEALDHSINWQALPRDGMERDMITRIKTQEISTSKDVIQALKQRKVEQSPYWSEASLSLASLQVFKPSDSFSLSSWQRSIVGWNKNRQQHPEKGSVTLKAAMAYLDRHCIRSTANRETTHQIKIWLESMQECISPIMATEDRLVFSERIKRLLKVNQELLSLVGDPQFSQRPASEVTAAKAQWDMEWRLPVPKTASTPQKPRL